MLEARDRVGGRVWRFDAGGLAFDAGAEAVDWGHTWVLALAEELGVATWEAEPWPHSAPSPELDAEIASLVARVDPHHPEDMENAGALDRQTLGGWLREHGASGDELAAAELAYAVASSTVPVDEMSLLAYAAKLAAGAAPTGLTLRLEGGPTAIAERLATACDIRLGTRVTAVRQEGGRVEVALADGRALRARRAVVAVPLTVQRELRFDPEPPEHRRTALAQARYGDAVKAALVDTGEERLPHVSEEGVLYRPDPRVPLLALFAGAGAAERARRREALAKVDWTRDPFSRGSYLILGPGHLTTWGRRLAEPHGRIHFAGAEASELPSYMEGAVRAGRRAADEVLAAG